MKKLLIISLMLMLCLVLISCGDPADTSDSPDETAALQVFMTDGTSDYAVVYPISMSSKSELGLAMEELKALTKDNAGDPFTFKSDYVVGVDDYSVYNGAKEILIGATNRTESEKVIKTLREKDYVICIEGGKLVIAGGSDEATAQAVKRFAAMYFSDTQPALILEETYRYEKMGDYPIDALTLDGSAINDFTVIYDSNTQKDASFLVSEIKRLTGYTLAQSENAEGLTNTITVAASDEKGSFASIANGNLTLSGDNEQNRSLAVSRFISELSKKGKEVAVNTDFSLPTVTEEAETIRLFDLSVYSTGYGVDSVNNRYPRLMTLIEKYAPTILCLQDVSPTWLTNMTKGIGNTAALTNKYDYVGTGRNNDTESVMQTIFYDKALYTLKESGTFWLSETPEWESVGWDGRTRSICTWAILTEKASGKDFAVMNTTLDPLGTQAQANGMMLILERAKEFDIPVILAGNLQTVNTATPYRKATETLFSDSEALAVTLGETGRTLNQGVGDGELVRVKTATDFVLLSYGDFTVDSYTLLKDLVDGEYVSNHWPILTEVSLAN